MSRIIKTVSLDKESDEIASKMGNFSKWVRNELKKHAYTISFTHTTPEILEKTGICNPSHSPRCAICFPYGKPYTSDIKFFNQGLITKERLQDLAKIRYEGIIEKPKPTIIDSERLDPPMRPIKERKYIRRALKYIWSFI